MNPRVLIADSDPEMLELYRRFFRGRWYQVALVGGGVECVGMLQTDGADVLVLHGNLLWGGMEGVLDRIRHGLTASPLAIVILERHASGQPHRVAPVVASLATPFRLGELDDLLCSILTLRRFNIRSDHISTAGKQILDDKRTLAL